MIRPVLMVLNTMFYILIMASVNASSFSRDESSIFHVHIPIVLKLDTGVGTTDEMFILRLINTTQRLINDDLRSLKWKNGVKYEVFLLDEAQILEYADDRISRYEIKLWHSEIESFFISPFDDKTIYVYQTDFLIAKNLLGGFIKNIILKKLLAFEILQYLEETGIEQDKLNESKDEYEQPLTMFLYSLRSSQGLNDPLVLTTPKLTLRITYKYTNPDIFNEFDYALFDELICDDLVDYLDGYVYLEPIIQFDEVGSDSDVEDDDVIYHEDGNVINVKQFADRLNFGELNLFIYLVDSKDEVYLQDTNEEVKVIENNYVRTIPQKGGFQVLKLSKEDKNEGEILSNQQQIQVLEILVGQLFSIIGLSPVSVYPEPKSPFIRLEFLIRRQLGINYGKLRSEGCCLLSIRGKRLCDTIRDNFENGHYKEALKLSWESLGC